MSIEQTPENFYLASIKIYDIQFQDNQTIVTAEDFKKSKILTQSQIELNPEDIMLLKIYSMESMKLLANF